MKYYRTLLLLLTLFIAKSAFSATYLDIKIFTGYKINNINFTPLSGKYSLFSAGAKVQDILKNETITIKIENDTIRIYRANVRVGSYISISLSGDDLINSFKVKPFNQAIKERIYDDDLRLSVSGGSFLIINHVELENYVAGVVQSEGGGSVKDNDFYLVQAITCRTYALNNLKKHARDGYNLCDSVHCQLYQNRCKSNEILLATYKTAGNVIVDKDNKMISAAFHSNSGGATVNSEDIWKIPTTYLKAVDDTFSLKMPNATWEFKILETKWLDYLASKFKYNINDPEKKNYALTFKQDTRKLNFTDSIPLTTIRTDLGLKSTWFSIQQDGAYLIFKGRGYGHGVGLSQQGAIRMAQLGYSYKDIIRFYYKDVDIVNFEKLMMK